MKSEKIFIAKPKLRLRWKGGQEDIVVPNNEKGIKKLQALLAKDEKVLVTQYPLYI